MTSMLYPFHRKFSVGSGERKGSVIVRHSDPVIDQSSSHRLSACGQGAETPRNYLLAAESGGETVGELWCDTTEPETVFINDFFVYPACRGHGWGNAMLRAVEELAAAQSFEQVVTHVYHTNRIALAMFESAGFTQIGPPKGGNIFLRKRYMRSPFLA